jgi:hypothetical protein
MYQQKSSWDEYFSGNPQTKFSSVQYNSRQNPKVSSVYVLNCLFNNINSESNGGALYCNSATSFLVESSSFFSCKTSSNTGGAIYFTNSNSEYVFHGVCGYNCYSGAASYQFAYIVGNNIASSKNYFNYSSISRCVNENSNSYHIICINGGDICCPSVNISMNKCQRYSGITCYPYTDSNYVTCSISFLSFADNIATEDICVLLNRGGAKYEMKYCNILRNTQETSIHGVIYSNGYTLIECSCILENTATYTFYVSSSSYSITLSNCTVDKTLNNQKLITQNTVTKSFVLGLGHLTTRNCFAEYDSAGTLTAFPIISRTTKKDFCICYTCKRNHILARIGDFFTLDWLFIVTFIHPNTLIDY